MNHYASTLYRLAPVWCQNLLLTGFGALLERERYGGRYAEFRDMLSRTEWLSHDELVRVSGRAAARHRRARLRHGAVLPAPVRRARLKPADIRGRADLPKLPLLTQRRHPRELRRPALHEPCPAARCATGPHQRHDRHAADRRLRPRHRLDDLRGVRSPLSVGRLPHGTRRRPHRGRARQRHRSAGPDGSRRSGVTTGARTSCCCRRSTCRRANLPAYFEALAAFKPAVLDGYPSTLYILAKYLQSRGETFPLRAAVTSSETLYDFQRAAIEEAFACRVFDYFALAERAVFSQRVRSARGASHRDGVRAGRSRRSPTGSRCSRGTTGRLVGTTLHNMAMPLIRYVTNDMTALPDRQCSCGRGLELMDDVTTKAEDVLTLKDGRLISPSVLTHPFKPLDCIEGSQIVQKAPDHVVIRIVRRPRLPALAQRSPGARVQSAAGQ